MAASVPFLEISRCRCTAGPVGVTFSAQLQCSAIRPSFLAGTSRCNAFPHVPAGSRGAREATAVIPIVMARSADPFGFGVQSLSRRATLLLGCFRVLIDRCFCQRGEGLVSVLFFG